jgi:hypothetical protein
LKRVVLIVVFTCACAYLQAQVNYITTIAGTGVQGYSGDGGPAINAEFKYPETMCLDRFGNLYVADVLGNNIRKIVLSTGIITTIAGTGTRGFSGDGGLATDATISYPQGICTDSLGNVYFGDSGNLRVRKINVSTGIITTILGTGSIGNSGDGGPATDAQIVYPTGLFIDNQNNLYVCDITNNNIRKITVSAGIVTTIAGNGTAGYSGDGGLAINAEFNEPFEIAEDTEGNIFVADALNNCLRKIDANTKIITTICGNGTAGYYGNGGPASSALLNGPYGIFIDKKNNLYFSDCNNAVIREIELSTNSINAIAGCGVAGFSGDDGLALNAEINPADVCVDNAGALYIADFLNYRIRKLYNPLAVAHPVQHKFSVYPNPASDELNIDGMIENTQYRMLSVTGACLRQGILVLGNNVLSIKNLVPGVYILELTDGNGERNMVRVVKE